MELFSFFQAVFAFEIRLNIHSLYWLYWPFLQSLIFLIWAFIMRIEEETYISPSLSSRFTCVSSFLPYVCWHLGHVHHWFSIFHGFLFSCHHYHGNGIEEAWSDKVFLSLNSHCSSSAEVVRNPRKAWNHNDRCNKLKQCMCHQVSSTCRDFRTLETLHSGIICSIYWDHLLKKSWEITPLLKFVDIRCTGMLNAFSYIICRWA